MIRNTFSVIVALFQYMKWLKTHHIWVLWPNIHHLKGERSSEFYETFFELEGVRGEEKGAFFEQY